MHLEVYNSKSYPPDGNPLKAKQSCLLTRKESHHFRGRVFTSVGEKR